MHGRTRPAAPVSRCLDAPARLGAARRATIRRPPPTLPARAAPQVYYTPRRPFYAQSTLPTIAGAPRLLRAVLLRERITLVHAHQAFSALGVEAMVHARTMGYRVRWVSVQGLHASGRLWGVPGAAAADSGGHHPATLAAAALTLPCQVVFTDHSLFGFADAASIATNKLLKAALSDVHAVICVSHTSRENTVLRACLPPARVSVIPNGGRRARPGGCWCAGRRCAQHGAPARKRGSAGAQLC